MNLEDGLGAIFLSNYTDRVTAVNVACIVWKYLYYFSLITKMTCAK